MPSLYKDDLDFDQLNAELMLLEGIISQRLPEVKTVASIDTITSIFSTEDIADRHGNVQRCPTFANLSSCPNERSLWRTILFKPASCQNVSKEHDDGDTIQQSYYYACK